VVVVNPLAPSRAVIDEKRSPEAALPFKEKYLGAGARSPPHRRVSDVVSVVEQMGKENWAFVCRPAIHIFSADITWVKAARDPLCRLPDHQSLRRVFLL